MSKLKIQFVDGHGRQTSREVDPIIDIRDFIGTPGFSLLFLAVAKHLSNSDIEYFLQVIAQKTVGVARSASWIQRRRQLFKHPQESPRPVGNRDGKEARAFALIRRRPDASIYDLRRLLLEHDIDRSREWIRRNRVRALQ